MDPSSKQPHMSKANMSSMGQLLLDNEKTVRKLSKVRQRRDHYARLYFQTLSELEETKWKLTRAMNTIRDLKAQGQLSTSSIPRQMMFHSNTTSPDSGASLSPGIDHGDYPGHRGCQRHWPANHRVAQCYGKEPSREAWLSREAWRDCPDGTVPAPYLGYLQSSRPLTSGTHLHPPPSGHAPSNHNPHRAPINCHHPAFSPARPNFVKSWSLSVSNLTQQQQEERQPSSPGGGLVTPSNASTFTLPSEVLPHHRYGSDHTHHAHPNHSHQPRFLRSQTLPPGPGNTMPPPSLENTRLASRSQDNLLGDENSTTGRRSAFRVHKVPLREAPPLGHVAASEAPFVGHAAARVAVSEATPMGYYRHCTESRGVMAAVVQPSSPTSPPATGNGGTSCYCDNLSSVDMLDLLLNIGSPQCRIQKLEVQRSRLGETKPMKLFCNSLARNRSIRELSLPENGIRGDCLALLLETIKAGISIKELKLRKNLIGQECAGLIKQFLADTTLDSLV